MHGLFWAGGHCGKTGASIRRRPERRVLAALIRAGAITQASVLLQKNAGAIGRCLKAQLAAVWRQLSVLINKRFVGQMPMSGQTLYIKGIQVNKARPAAAGSALCAVKVPNAPA